MSLHQITLMGVGICVMLTMYFTVQLMKQHLFYWKNPKEQKAIIIIILMAPIYAVDSFVGLLDIRGSKAFFMFLDSVKECYEALVSVFRTRSFTCCLFSRLDDKFEFVFLCRWLPSSWLWCIVTWIYRLAKILCRMELKEERFIIHFQWLFSRYLRRASIVKALLVIHLPKGVLDDRKKLILYQLMDKL